MAGKDSLRKTVARLEERYGVPTRPVARGPFEQVLWETAAYLVPDERRGEVFRALEREVGTTPKDILATPTARLAHVIQGGGMRPTMRAERIREAARIAIEIGDLDAAARRPLEEATRTFARFPAIGRPGAEKILLFEGAHAVAALESNGLRVLVRLGYGREQKAYAATYRSVQEAIAAETRDDGDFMRKAHVLLRRHGQETCRRANPLCEECPVSATCAYFAAARAQ